MNDAEMRERVRETLRSLNDTTEDSGTRSQLAGAFELGDSGRLQFEVSPFSNGIHLVQTGDEVVPDDVVWNALPDGLPDAAEGAGLDVLAALNEEILPWFADRWTRAGGPDRYRPAYAFFHGGLDQPRYDLESRRWLDVSEVWPDEQQRSND